jgi:hypothetical protein
LSSELWVLSYQNEYRVIDPMDSSITPHLSTL